MRSTALGVAGVADAVELHDGSGGAVPFPVEHKRGRPKAHRADEVQLCAQAICLEEMLGVPVPAGALFYGQTRRRQEVAFDAELRALTASVLVAGADGAGPGYEAVGEARDLPVQLVEADGAQGDVSGALATARVLREALGAAASGAPAAGSDERSGLRE